MWTGKYHLKKPRMNTTVFENGEKKDSSLKENGLVLRGLKSGQKVDWKKMALRQNVGWQII